MTDNQPFNQADEVDEWVKVAARDRNRDALGRLFDHFYPPIFAYCSRRLLVRAVAEDITSEVFLKVAKAIHGFSGTTSEDFRRWLFRITTNEINAHLRQSIRQLAILDAAVQMGAVGKEASFKLLAVDSDVDWEQIYYAIGELSQREQSIISLRFFGDMTHNEIAQVLEMKTGTVRVALTRSLHKLRDRLRETPASISPSPRAIERGDTR